MADYEKRLQRLEERATIADDRGALLLEAVRKRTAELLSSKEVLALELPDVPEEELAARLEALLAVTRLKADQMLKRNNSPQ